MFTPHQLYNIPVSKYSTLADAMAPVQSIQESEAQYAHQLDQPFASQPAHVQPAQLANHSLLRCLIRGYKLNLNHQSRVHGSLPNMIHPKLSTSFVPRLTNQPTSATLCARRLHGPLLYIALAKKRNTIYVSGCLLFVYWTSLVRSFLCLRTT